MKTWIILSSLLVTVAFGKMAPSTLTKGEQIREECGVQNLTEQEESSESSEETSDIVERIVGGTEAQVGEYPWMVSFGRRMTDLVQKVFYYSQMCGASLISKDWVVTAAHCVQQEKMKKKKMKKSHRGWTTQFEEDFVVRLGIHNLSTNSGKIMKPLQMIPHPLFDMSTLTHDIALMKLPESIESFEDNINTVCLNSKREAPEVGRQCFVTGWGMTNETYGELPDVLQKVQIEILPQEDCQHLNIQAGKICAGKMEGGKDSCQGDSGGPLVCSEEIDGRVRWFQAGVVSYGIGCAREGFPGVYTDVPFYLDWIKKTIHHNS